MKAVGYFRETPSHDETLAQQHHAFREFCAREGYEPGDTFADGGGANGYSSGFRQLVSYLRSCAAHDVIVVVPSIASLGDEMSHAARRLFQIEGLGGKVTPITGDADIVYASTGDGDANSLGDRVRAAMRRKAVKGEVLGRPPYGYKVGNRRRLELIPEEAVVIRYIFRLYLQEGMGIRLIARRLNAEGLKTRRGGNWSMVSIRDILRNRVYLGTYSRFGVKVPGSHPALVSADDFRGAQDRMNARRTSTSGTRVVSQFLLSGIAFCGYCGNKLIGVSRKQAWKRRSGERVENSYRYYQCESRTNQSVCNYHTRRADDLERELRTWLAGGFLEAGGFPQSDDTLAVDQDQEREREKLRARLRAIDKRIDRYIDAAARGRLTKDKMRKLSVAAAGDRLNVEDALESIERQIDEHLGAEARKTAREHGVAVLLEAWESMRFADRQAGLRATVARMTVTDDDISIELRC